MGFQDWTVAQIKSLRDTVKKLIDGSKSISELDEKQDVLKGDYIPVYSTEEKETNKYDLSKLLFLINGFQKSDEIDKPNGYVGLNSQSKINPDFLPELSGYRIKPVAGTKKYQLLKGKEVVSEIDLTPYWNHINNSSIHVTQQEKEDWGEKYSLVFNTATNEIILFKGGKEISKAKIELPESIPWTDLTLSSGARASRAKYKINMRTVMFDVYNLEIPKTRPFTIFNIPEHLRPEKDRYIGGVVRLTTYETYSLIVKRNGNVMINFPMEKLRNDRFSFTVEYTLD